MEPFHYPPSFQERIWLDPETPVCLRLLNPADQELLKRGMEHLSAESRYRRFLFAKGSLTPEELTYLTDIDGINHFAIGALSDAPASQGEGMAVARFIRGEDQPEVAEPSIVVVDAFQHRGLGSILFAHLMHAARERGVVRFSGSLLTSNQAMIHLLRRLAPRVRFQTQGPLTSFDFSLNASGDRPRTP